MFSDMPKPIVGNDEITNLTVKISYRNTGYTYYDISSDELKSFFLGVIEIAAPTQYQHYYFYDKKTDVIEYDGTPIDRSKLSYQTGHIILDATGTTGARWGGWCLLIDGDFSLTA